MNRTCSLLAALLLVSTATAQLQVFGGDGPRMASTKIFWHDGPVGMICVQYGQPEWKPEYNAMIAEAKGKKARLGKDFWTTLNTSVALTIGAVKVPAGSYYLGVGSNAKDGSLELLVMDAKGADAKGFAPFMPDAWVPDYVVPMKHDDAAKETRLLTIQIRGDDPAKMSLRLSWGNHEMTAALVAHMAPPRAGTGAQSDKDGDPVGPRK